MQFHTLTCHRYIGSKYLLEHSHRPGVDSTNILHAAFAHAHPIGAKRQSSHQRLFVLLGSACVKAASKMLVKLTLGLNFINILQAAFMHADSKSAEKAVKLSVFFTLLGSIHMKALRKHVGEIEPRSLSHKGAAP